MASAPTFLYSLHVREPFFPQALSPPLKTFPSTGVCILLLLVLLGVLPSLSRRAWYVFPGYFTQSHLSTILCDSMSSGWSSLLTCLHYHALQTTPFLFILLLGTSYDVVGVENNYET